MLDPFEVDGPPNEGLWIGAAIVVLAVLLVLVLSLAAGLFA